MQRILGIAAAVLVAAAIAFFALRPDGEPDAASAPIEKLLASGRTADARAELSTMRDRLDPATAGYLDGLILLAEGRDGEAAAVLARAHRVRPADWRIVSALAAATANSGRFPEALALVDAFVAAAPDDERGLAASAQYRLDGRTATPDPGKALAALDRIAALTRRVAPPGDPTAVPDAKLRRLRTQALVLSGRGMDALFDARAGTTETPNDPEAWFLLGEAARRMPVPKADESLRAYRRASELAPSSRRHAEQLALALIAFQGEGREILAIADALLAASPDDPSLRVLRARALVRVDRIDDAGGIYRELLGHAEKLPRDVRLAALRNLAVLLYDWKQGGRQGEYLDEAWGLLKRYAELGGEIDDDLQPTWRDLEERDRKPGEKR